MWFLADLCPFSSYAYAVQVCHICYIPGTGLSPTLLCPVFGETNYPAFYVKKIGLIFKMQQFHRSFANL